jgi:ubiquinone/menaquinone biosynthesis C-methylase UbiE
MVGSMSARLSDSINTHSFPRVFFTFPLLLRFYHFVVFITTLRNWYCYKTIRRAIGKVNKNFTLLDAGCGAGDYIIPLARKFPSASFTGVDKAEGNIHTLLNFVKKRKTGNCSFVNANIESLTSTECYDFLLCITVMQYIKYDEEALKSFYSLLKPGGKIFLYSPVNYKRFFSFSAVRNPFCVKRNYDYVQQIERLYSAEELIKKVTDAGFNIASVEYAYGLFGMIAFEIHSAFLLLIKSTGFLFAPIIAMIYLPVVFPVTLIFNLIDYFSDNKTGNGTLISAEKNPLF